MKSKMFLCKKYICYDNFENKEKQRTLYKFTVAKDS